MKIALASDLHIEFHAEFPEDRLRFPAESEVIVLAGDIDVGPQAVETVRRIAGINPGADILWVAGNHEFYMSDIDEQIAFYRQAFLNDPRIHFLENDHITLNGIRFLGCTLWTDFSLLGADRQHDAMNQVREFPDFRAIEIAGETYTPEAAQQRFQESVAFLTEQLNESEPSKTVVLTHFPPGLETRNKNFEIDLYVAYFQANVVPLIETCQPALWVYGHNHFNEDTRIGRTRAVSNQLGYPGEDCGGNFDSGKLVEV